MTLTYKQLSPQQLSHRRHLHLIDIRSEEERRDTLGFIPGSLFAPEGRSLDALLELLPQDDAIAITCLGGSRATACILAQLHQGSTREFYNLKGGLLAWRAAQLPVARFPHDNEGEEESSSGEFFTKMRGCFVGEIAEVIVERDLDLNPLDLLNAGTQLARLHQNTTPFEERLIYFTGYISWQIGSPIAHIAQNMSWALAHRHVIAEADPAQLMW